LAATIGRVPKRNGVGIDLLADLTRRRIVALIALGMGQPSKLGREIGLSRPATSRQLRLLRDAGLIAVRPSYLDRRRRVYFIEPRRLGQITAWLAGTEVGRAFPDAYPAATIRPMVPHGRNYRDSGSGQLRDGARAQDARRPRTRDGP